MIKIWCELFRELYIVCYLLRKGSQLTTRNWICLVSLNGQVNMEVAAPTMTKRADNALVITSNQN